MLWNRWFLNYVMKDPFSEIKFKNLSETLFFI